MIKVQLMLLNSVIMYERSATTTVTFVFFIFLMTVCDCADCQNGNHNNSLNCIQCPVHCVFCNSSEYCFNCEEGFSGQKCQFSCSNCKPDTECDQDNYFCKEGCKDGFSGVQCDDVCDNKCQSCDRYNPAECLMCKTNQTCEEACPAHCLSNKCTEKKCTDGCRSGYWGDSCDKKCQLTCSKDVCDRENGTCSEDNCTLGECDKRNGNRTEDDLFLYLYRFFCSDKDYLDVRVKFWFISDCLIFGVCDKDNGTRTEDLFIQSF